MPDATDTRDAAQRARDLAETLLRQATDYDEFGEKVGGELGPHYRELARALRCRVAVLLGPYGLTDSRPAPRPARLKPRDVTEAAKALQVFLSMVTARRSGLTTDGAELLGDLDPGAVLWTGVAAVMGILNSISEDAAQALLSSWGMNAARMIEGASTGG